MTLINEAIPTSYWEQLSDPPTQHFEVLEGKIIVNPAPRPIHQGVARELANALSAAVPSDYRVVCDVEWRTGGEGQVTNALRPDICVAHVDQLRRTVALAQPPLLAVEIISPSNSGTEWEHKLETYACEGLENLVLVEINHNETTCTVNWYRAEGEPLRWTLVARKAGKDPLAVKKPFPFRVIPNDLLPW